MQSRYYNPEWGRFINADGITGQTGKLLSHNMFAYCQNDPVNSYDPTGFVMVEDMEGGLGYHTHDSVSSPGVSYDSKGAAITTGVEVVHNVPIKTTIPYYNMPVKASMAEIEACSGVFSVVSIAALGYSIHSNHALFKPSEARAMDAIDLLTWAGGILKGAALVSAGVGLAPIILTGLAIGGAGYLAKKGVDAIFKKWF